MAFSPALLLSFVRGCSFYHLLPCLPAISIVTARYVVLYMDKGDRPTMHFFAKLAPAFLFIAGLAAFPVALFSGTMLAVLAASLIFALLLFSIRWLNHATVPEGRLSWFAVGFALTVLEILVAVG